MMTITLPTSFAILISVLLALDVIKDVLLFILQQMKGADDE